MERTVRMVDDSVKDQVLRYPTVSMIKKLFPEVRMHGRSSMCNPLRGERHDSLSCFIDRYGYPRWKDHATGESGDNIDFFRMAYPELDYADAVDRLAWIVLGRGALREVDPTVRLPRRETRKRPAHVAPVEAPPVLGIVSVSPLVPASCSRDLVSYWRSRGISDVVAGGYGERVVYENPNLKGRALMDSSSGLPLYGDDGEPLINDGLYEAVGLRNGIGGYSLRVPDAPGREGFKGCNVQFISVIYADGSRPRGRVAFFGDGDALVEGLWYDQERKLLYVNARQGMCNVEPWAARFAFPFLEGWTGRYLEGRERTEAVSVVDSLNGPVNRTAVVVEGLFDALSYIELERMSGRGPVPGADIVVLNSVSNLKKAVPFLSMHAEVRSFLDNDMTSGAGQRTFVQMRDAVSSYSGRCGVASMVTGWSGLFYPCKDLNEYLMKTKGFPVDAQERGQKKKEMTPDGVCAGSRTKDAAPERPANRSGKFGINL